MTRYQCNFPKIYNGLHKDYVKTFNMKCTLTLWGRVTHICVDKLTIIASGNGLSPGRRQAIIWTNAGVLLIGPLGTNFSEILIVIETFSFKKKHLKMSSGKCRPFCLGLNVLTGNDIGAPYIRCLMAVAMKLFHWYTAIQCSQCNSIEDWVSEDEIYRYPIFKVVALTWLEWHGTSIVFPVFTMVYKRNTVKHLIWNSPEQAMKLLVWWAIY